MDVQKDTPKELSDTHMRRENRRMFAAMVAGLAAVGLGFIAHRIGLLSGPAEAGFPPALLVLAAAAIAMATAVGVAHLHHTRKEFHQVRSRLVARSHQLASLHALGQDLAAARDPDVLARLAVEAAQQLTDADAAALILTSEPSGDLQTAAALGDPPPAAVESLARSIFAARAPGERRDLPAPLRGALAVPLWIDREMTGVLGVWTRCPEALRPRRLELLGTVAQQAAVALERARHFEAASTDSLTGLARRDGFFQRVHAEFERARRYGGDFALMMLDIDRFKGINDTHGHLAGDAYLMEVGSVVAGRLRAADVACRFGGDELALLLPETDRKGAAQYAERLRRDLAALRVPYAEAEIGSSVSIGVATYRSIRPEELADLLGAADEALYRAKSRGRNAVALAGSRFAEVSVSPGESPRTVELPAAEKISGGH